MTSIFNKTYSGMHTNALTWRLISSEASMCHCTDLQGWTSDRKQNNLQMVVRNPTLHSPPGTNAADNKGNNHLLPSPRMHCYCVAFRTLRRNSFSHWSQNCGATFNHRNEMNIWKAIQKTSNIHGLAN